MSILLILERTHYTAYPLVHIWVFYFSTIKSHLYTLMKAKFSCQKDILISENCFVNIKCLFIVSLFSIQFPLQRSCAMWEMTISMDVSSLWNTLAHWNFMTPKKAKYFTLKVLFTAFCCSSFQIFWYLPWLWRWVVSVLRGRKFQNSSLFHCIGNCTHTGDILSLCQGCCTY